jgi:aspartyl protease family protein
MLRYLGFAFVLIMLSLFGVQKLQGNLTQPHVTEAKSQPSAPAGARSAIITAENGHYAAEARVDGHEEVAFMVDTGASQITLRESDAARLGYRPGPADYVIKIETANGEGRAAAIQLTSIEVGDIMVRDVRAIVVPDSALSVNLLGMSFLSRVRWTQERGQLVLEQ